MRTISLLVAYDGTDYVGWQRQATGVSVQALLEDALSRIADSPVMVAGAGRTDSGVHAAGQVASATVTCTLDPATLRRALNAVLPPAVRILRVDERGPDFHARFSARCKTYEYRILNGPVLSPFWERYVWHVPFRLDHEAMADAAGRIAGVHDFAAFRSIGTDVHTTVRTVLRSALECRPAAAAVVAGAGVPAVALADGMLLTYVITGTGFLRHMVRAIVGTLVEVGAGRAQPSLMESLLAAGRREEAGPTAPASGLCLASVEYDDVLPPVAAHR